MVDGAMIVVRRMNRHVRFVGQTICRPFQGGLPIVAGYCRRRTGFGKGYSKRARFIRLVAGAVRGHDVECVISCFAKLVVGVVDLIGIIHGIHGEVG